MKLRDWFRMRKERREARRREKVERALITELPELTPLGEDPEEIVPPESRYTEEYREFLKKQEPAKANSNVDYEEN